MATMGMVAPKEWLSRTSLTFSRTRGPTLLRADDAYAKYFDVRSEGNKKALHDALGAYLREKGGNWEQVDRDKKSGGLMKFVFEFTLAGPTVKNVLELRVPESRHGVLYLWQNADISTQWAKIFLEGALTVGGSTLGLLQAGNYRAGDQFQGLGVIAKDSPGDTAASVGRLAPTIGGIVAPPKGTGVRVETPTPVVKLADLPDDAGILEKARAVLGKFFDSVWNTIRQKVGEIWQEVRFKFLRGGFVGTIGGAIGKLAVFILGKVAMHAAPFVANGIEIGQGICQAIIAAKDRVSAHLLHQKFVVRPGHPAQIAQAIENQMNWAIAKGAYNAAKGGAKLAGNLMSWGASALIDVIAAAIEFAWKFLTRLAEGVLMRGWIDLVKALTRNRNDWKADPRDGVWRPSIVYNDKGFREVFEAGCDASVCIPMMTLNSGIAGDQMMFMKMFDDTGALLGQGSGQDRPTAAAQAQFDAGTKYFTLLKENGRNYLESTGFTFMSSDPVARGLMWHAISHHQGGRMANADKVLHLLAGR
ncbi:MAG: hypothetical protein U1E21_19975 [Reyranellaceae bacterium]